MGCHFLLQCMKVKSESEVTQSCPTLCDPMDCSLPGSFIHAISQARVLEWVAIAFSIAQFIPYQNSSGSFPGTRTNNWYRKRCSASLIIGEMPMRTTMRYHLTPARVSVIKKIRENMYQGGWREEEPCTLFRMPIYAATGKHWRFLFQDGTTV